MATYKFSFMEAGIYRQEKQQRNLKQFVRWKHLAINAIIGSIATNVGARFTKRIKNVLTILSLRE